MTVARRERASAAAAAARAQLKATDVDGAQQSDAGARTWRQRRAAARLAKAEAQEAQCQARVTELEAQVAEAQAAALAAPLGTAFFALFRSASLALAACCTLPAGCQSAHVSLTRTRVSTCCALHGCASYCLLQGSDGGGHCRQHPGQPRLWHQLARAACARARRRQLGGALEHVGPAPDPWRMRPPLHHLADAVVSAEAALASRAAGCMQHTEHGMRGGSWACAGARQPPPRGPHIAAAPPCLPAAPSV